MYVPLYSLDLRSESLSDSTWTSVPQTLSQSVVQEFLPPRCFPSSDPPKKSLFRFMVVMVEVPYGGGGCRNLLTPTRWRFSKTFGIDTDLYPRVPVRVGP